MRFGRYEIFPIVTSTFALDGGAMFGIIPKALWSRVSQVDERNRISMVTRSLLIKGEGRNILVDTGNGDKYSSKFVNIYAIDWEEHNLRRGLAGWGLSPEDITDVIITHLHFDHAGGNTVRTAEGEVKPTFPNATYWVQAEHLEAARHPTEKDRASFFPENWEPLATAGQLEILKGDESPWPDIHLEVLYGHTTAMQLPVIRNDDSALMYAADLFPTKAHIPLPWIMAYDNQPLVTLEEKKRLLPRIVAEKWIIFLEHDPDFAACRVVEDEKGWKAGEEVALVS